MSKHSHHIWTANAASCYTDSKFLPSLTPSRNVFIKEVIWKENACIAPNFCKNSVATIYATEKNIYATKGVIQAAITKDQLNEPMVIVSAEKFSALDMRSESTTKKHGSGYPLYDKTGASVPRMVKPVNPQGPRPSTTPPSIGEIIER